MLVRRLEEVSGILKMPLEQVCRFVTYMCSGVCSEKEFRVVCS